MRSTLLSNCLDLSYYVLLSLTLGIAFAGFASLAMSRNSEDRADPEAEIELRYAARLERPASAATCGYHALLACAFYLRVEVEPSVLWASLDWTSDGLSMLALKRGLSDVMGVDVAAVQMTAQDLLQEQGPVVFFVERGRTEAFPGNHFLVYLGVARGKTKTAVIVDPSAGLLFCPLSTLEQLVTGPCLVVTDKHGPHETP